MMMTIRLGAITIMMMISLLSYDNDNTVWGDNGNDDDILTIL